MVLPTTISQNSREKLGIIVCIACVILAACGAVLIGLALYMQIHINNELILLESYNAGMLPHFLISVGTLMILLNAVSAKIGFDAGYSNTSERIRLVLVPLLAILTVLCLVIMSAGIVCLTNRASIEDALHNGLQESMKRYKNNINVKVALDELQLRSRCCGSRSYKDWFNVGWINTDYVDKKHPVVRSKLKDGDLYVDSVPFSCCNVGFRGPCIAHSIAAKSMNAIFDVKTLNQAGCTDTLMDSLENKLLYPTGSFVLILFGAQALVTIIFRYLQTSVQSAYEEGDIEGAGKGFCFPDICPAGCCPGDPDKYVRAGALQASRGEPVPSTEVSEDNEETEESFVEQPSGDTEESSFLGQAQEGMGGMDQVQDFDGGGGGRGGGEDSHGGGGKQKEKQKDKNKSNKRDKSSSKDKSKKDKSKKDRSRSKSKKDDSKSSKKSKDKSKSPKKSKDRSKSPKKSKDRSKSPKTKSKSPKRSKPPNAKKPKGPKSPKAGKMKSAKLKSPRKPKRMGSPKRTKGGGGRKFGRR